MSPLLETSGLGRRYGSNWALRNCDLSLPAGRVIALVGPNGAGKTTLLRLATGLLKPTEGTITVFGSLATADSPASLARIAFVAQDHPLYERFRVRELLRMGRALNLRWDQEFAERRLDSLDIPLSQRAGTLSGGQHAQVALTLALAKRPKLLVLDEPVAGLDPLARRTFLQSLMSAVAEDDFTVLLSSHILAELERVCDYLIVITGGRIQITGEIDELLASHRLLTGPADGLMVDAPGVVQVTRGDRYRRIAFRPRRPRAGDRASHVPRVCARRRGHLSTGGQPRDQGLHTDHRRLPRHLLGNPDGGRGRPEFPASPRRDSDRRALPRPGVRTRHLAARLDTGRPQDPLADHQTHPRLDGRHRGLARPQRPARLVVAPRGPIGLRHRRFNYTAPVLAGYFLLAVAIGILAGTIIRRAIPAMAATLAIFLPIRLFVEFGLRSTYMTPITEIDPVPGSRGLVQKLSAGDNWILDKFVLDPSGRRLSDAEEFDILGGGTIPDATLAEHGLKQAVTYHPAARFWEFQLIETAIFGGLAFILLTLVIWHVRRR